jgi:hypothetical protein
MNGKCSYHREKNRIQNYMITPHKQLASFTIFKSLTRYCSLNNEFTVTQAVPPAARSMPHLRYLELAGNPITTLSNASFQGAMEHLQELDIRHLTLNYFEVKQLILPSGASIPRDTFLPHSSAHIQTHTPNTQAQTHPDCLRMTTVSGALLPWKSGSVL